MAESFTVKAEQTGSERPVAPAADVQKGTDANARPEWLDNKFKSPEQMAESYKHLEAELTRLRQGKAPEAEAKPTEEAKPTAEAEANGDEKPKTEEEKKADEVTDKLKADGLDIDGMNARFWEKGELDPDDRTKLVDALKKDFGDSAEKLLDTFTTAQKEAFEYRQFRVHEPMGGEEKAKEMIAWAKSTLPQAQKEAINSLWESNDVSKMVEGSKLVATLYNQANSTKPARVLDGTPAAASQAGYASEAEMRADMSDPRYKNDPAFQQKVVDKLKVTSAF